MCRAIIKIRGALSVAVAGALLAVVVGYVAPSSTPASVARPGWPNPFGVSRVAVDYIYGFVGASGTHGTLPYQCLREHHVVGVARFAGNAPFGVTPARTTVLAVTPDRSGWRVHVRALFADGERFDHVLAVFCENGRYCVATIVR